MSETAKERYDSRYNTAIKRIRALQQELKEHRDEFQSGDVDNWAYAGDLAYVNEQLLDALTFIQG
jgi:hypothetical protein